MDRTVTGERGEGEEFSGDQHALIAKLEPGQGVFGVEVRIPRPRTGAVMP